MHSKVLNHGTGSAQAAANYVLRGHGDDGISVEVLRGDVEAVCDLADTLDFKQKYKSFIFGFHEDDKPTPEQISELIDVYEKHAFAGLPESSYTTAWVKHQDEKTGRIDLHFLTPCVELSTGKSLNIAPPNHLKYFDCARDFLNAKHGWKSPDIEAHPENAANFSGKPTAPVWGDSKKEVTAALNHHVADGIALGLVSNRADLLKYLKESGLVITRASEKSVSVKTPNMARAIKLAGAIYERGFEVNSIIEKEAVRSANAGRRADAATIKGFKIKLDKAAQRRFKYNQARYAIDAENERVHELAGSENNGDFNREGSELDRSDRSDIERGNGGYNIGDFILQPNANNPAGLSNRADKQKQNDGLQRKRLAARSQQYNHYDAELIAQQIAKILEMLAKLFGFNANFTGVKNDGNRDKAYEIITATERINEQRTAELARLNLAASRITRATAATNPIVGAAVERLQELEAKQAARKAEIIAEFEARAAAKREQEQQKQQDWDKFQAEFDEQNPPNSSYEMSH